MESTVLPVKPCTNTLVSLLINTLMIDTPYALTAATTFSAASDKPFAEINFKPDSSSNLAPNSALLPSKRTTTGTVTFTFEPLQ